MFKIEHLSNHKEHIETISKWMAKEWGASDDIRFFKSILNHSLSKTNLPQTFVALDGEKPIGTIGLWRCDMVSRQDLFPWLSALYVIPAYRNKGIGKQLQSHLLSYAKSIGYEDIYLYTDLENYYEQIGWEFVDTGITYSGEYDKIYKKSLVE
ncbi:putative N-acetyltransferase YhbS [Acetoanaerobium pronyense]|uniref:N-acetyltransferase YhbS n=1 Tax=Acetoanaerobium pronyense TaxID=1482736 RepID=A0ABS4KLJ8_9FIRM|nr:GNAT family N-acetyltransferase [Acetoanaerobium pronyense]MBP2028662.1 putative N-acetyltransferase YhbS [Acetoanaerobium pronyense]